jgi:alkylation response protein AidB-like acyl-CoA dehydrogenase
VNADAELVAKQIRAILAGPRAEAAFAAMAGTREPDPRPLYRLLGERGLLAPSWPPAYGGRGLPARCAAATVGELVACGVPEVLHTLSVQICGNFLLTAATDEQRALLLPVLAAGRATATVLYSEPATGSDLSTMDTKAEPDGTGWRITGRKVYSVKTALADYGLVAARTSTESTRYRGITLFLVPLDLPGVTVDRLDSLADEAFADVRLDGVTVPATSVIGPVGGAWPLITDALALERTGVDYVAKADRWLRAAGVPNGRLRTHIEAARALSLRCVDQLDTGRVDPVWAAATKLWCSETARSVAWWCTETVGWRDGVLESAYREAPGLTLSAGTSEMMLELVAGSGLPIPDADEPVAAELRAAVRAVAQAYDERDAPTACWPELAGIGVFGLAVPVAHGGLDLGQRAAVLCCHELGRQLHDGGLLDTLTAIDVLVRSGRPVPPLDGTWRAEPDGLTDRPVAEVMAAGRVRRAAWLCVLAAACLDHTVHRARTREQFDRPLIANQAVAFRLARLAVRLAATTALVLELAARSDDGAPDVALSAGVLAEAGTLALDAGRDAVHLHGAFGMTDGSPVRRHYLAAPPAVAADATPAALWAEAEAG